MPVEKLGFYTIPWHGDKNLPYASSERHRGPGQKQFQSCLFGDRKFYLQVPGVNLNLWLFFLRWSVTVYRSPILLRAYQVLEIARWWAPGRPGGVVST